MITECQTSAELKDIVLRLEGNNLSAITGKSLAQLVRASDKSYHFLWRSYSFTAHNLESLVDSIGEKKTLNWKKIDLRRINLSSINGRTLACLFKFSPELMHIDMSFCSLSGSIVNEMMEECGRMNVVMKDNMLSLERNDLSAINGKSLAKLGRVIHKAWSSYSLTAENLQMLVSESIVQNETMNWKKVDLSRINLSSISGRTLACLFKFSPELIYVDMSFCCLSSIIVNEMMEECSRMNVTLKDNMVRLEENDLSAINCKSIAELVRVIHKSHNVFKWRSYSFTIDTLHSLVKSIGKSQTLNWKNVDLSRINLSSMNGRTLACLFKSSPDLIHINLMDCSLSFSIVNEIVEECVKMNVVLKENMLGLEGNDLSAINGKSLAELLVVIHNNTPYDVFEWRRYSFTADTLERMVESIGQNQLLNWKRVNFSGTNLSSIRGKTLACLLKFSPDLIHINMKHCSLSCIIINEMMEECARMNIVLKSNMLSLEGNDLSAIKGKSLAQLVQVIFRSCNFIWGSYSLTPDNVESLVESIDQNKTLKWTEVDLSRMNLSSISGRKLACLLKFSPELIHIDLSHCSLLGVIVNEMMEECGRMNVIMKDSMLSIHGNDLSAINGKSLVGLLRVINTSDIIWSSYSFTADNLESLVESIGQNETLNWKRVDFSEINLLSISGRTLACLLKFSPELVHIDFSHCSLIGSILNEMMGECGRMNVEMKDNMLSVEGNNLSTINDKLLSELVRVIDKSDITWSNYAFTADNLQSLVELIGQNETLNWKRVDLSEINLSSLSGRTLACLFKFSPDLIYIDISYCSLSGSIVNEMMDECSRMNVVLKDNMLNIEGNNFSAINGKSLVQLLRVIDKSYDFLWSSYSFTADNLENLVESITEKETVNWKKVDLSMIDLSSISGRTLASFIQFSPDLIHINMSHCSLSGSILNEMMEECGRMNVVMNDNMLSIEGNNFSVINGKSLSHLVRVIDKSYDFLWSSYSFTADNLECLVESITENETVNWKKVDFSRIDLSSISGRTLASFLKFSPDLIHINMSHCNLSGSILNEMMEKCGRMNVIMKDNMLNVEGNNFSAINGKSLAALVRVIDKSDIIWSSYSFTANNIRSLVESISQKETLNWKRVDLSEINLSSISGKTLACLFKFSPNLIYIDISYCSLSGSIVNEMMEECARLNVVLKNNMLSLEENDLSVINGKSLAQLVRVIDMSYDFLWSSYYFTADNLESLVKSIAENETVNWKRVDLSRIDLSSISGITLASFLKFSPDLIHINMSYCSLSGSILNEMMEECARMNVVMKDNMLSLEKNYLSAINGKSLAQLVRAINTSYDFLWSSYSFSADNLENLVESITENETVNWKRVDLSRINLSSISGRNLASFLKFSPDLIHINMSHCSLSGSILNEMMEECARMNVVMKDNMLSIEGNNFSAINGKSLALLVRVIDKTDIIWSSYSFTANNIEGLVESIVQNETLYWTELDLSGINLSSISGGTLASLLKFSPDLIQINMSDCCLTGSIINEMMEECARMNVVLKNNMLILEKNDLSVVNGKSLAQLVKVIHKPYVFLWKNYSFTADNLESLVESIGKHKTLNWAKVDLSGINLSSISGRTLACLFKFSPYLIHINMIKCCLSGTIVNEMIDECARMKVVLKYNMVNLNRNDLSAINGKSIVKFLHVIDRFYILVWRSYSFTAFNLESLVESIGENETLNWKRVDLSRIDLSSISGRTLACLIKFSPRLNYVDMSHCSLSGSIVNEMMEECARMNVVLIDNMITFERNDLSAINGESLAKLVRVNSKSLYFKWRHFSFTADNIECLVESLGQNETLNWKWVYLNRTNLSSISGRTLACLLKFSPDLIHIDMSDCSLSSSIVNEMMEECTRMNVVLRDNVLNLDGNGLTNDNN